MVSEEKIYLKEKSCLRKLIEDMAELQKWDVSPPGSDGIESRSAEGDSDEIVCHQEIYGLRYKYEITIRALQGASSVRIGTNEVGGSEAIRRQFLLLEKLIAFDEERTK